MMKIDNKGKLFEPVIIEGLTRDKKYNGNLALAIRTKRKSRKNPDESLKYIVRIKDETFSIQATNLSFRNHDPRHLSLPEGFLSRTYAGIPCSTLAYKMNVDITPEKHANCSSHDAKQLYRKPILQAFKQHFEKHPVKSIVNIIIGPGPGYDLDMLLPHLKPSHTLIIIEPMVCYHEKLLERTSQHGFESVQVIAALAQEIPEYLHVGKNGHKLPINWWFAMDVLSFMRNDELRTLLRRLNAPGISVMLNRPSTKLSEGMSPNFHVIPSPLPDTNHRGEMGISEQAIVLLAKDNGAARSQLKRLKKVFSGQTTPSLEVQEKFIRQLELMKVHCRVLQTKSLFDLIYILYQNAAGGMYNVITSSVTSSVITCKLTMDEVRSLRRVLRQAGHSIPKGPLQIVQHGGRLATLPADSNNLTIALDITMFDPLPEMDFYDISAEEFESGILAAQANSVSRENSGSLDQSG